MASNRSKPQVGDLLEVVVDGRQVYLHYLGDDPKYGAAVRVLECERDQLDDSSLLLNGAVTFYPVATALAQSLVAVVGNVDVGSVGGVPSRWRQPGGRDIEGNTTNWRILEPDGSRSIRRVPLSDEDAALPIAVVKNHESLCILIRQMWESADPIDDQGPVSPLPEPKPSEGEEGAITHYLYFPDDSAAVQAAGELMGHGFNTESRLGADGENWLVLVNHGDDRDFDATAKLVGEITERLGGEYDGWERKIS